MQDGSSKLQYPVCDPVKLGARLKEICDARNVTPTELKEYLHLGSTQAIYMWFHGQRFPSVDNLRAVCRYLGERVDDLLNSERAEQMNRILEDDLLPPHGKRVLLYWMRLQRD